MTQVRRDPLTGDTILIASERMGRPNEYQRDDCSKQTLVDCPFCPENEHITLEPRFDYHSSGTFDIPSDEPNPLEQKALMVEPCEDCKTSDWVSRVVPNLYPALEPSVGLHRVIIESRRHVNCWSQLKRNEQTCSLRAYQHQIQLAMAEGFPYAQIFKNSGPAAGASLTHCHSQIVASPRVPDRVRLELAGAVRHLCDTGSCFFCKSIAESDVFVVESTSAFTACCPYASRFPYETWIIPRDHACRFEDASPDIFDDLAGLLERIVGAFRKVLPSVSYNWLLHTTPSPSWLLEPTDVLEGTTDQIEAGYHWHIEMFPRAAQMAGYEFATSQYINVVDPQDAAERLANEISRSTG